MVIIALVLLVLGVALLKEGSQDAAKIGGIMMAAALCLLAYRVFQIDTKTYDAWVFWFCSGFSKLWFGVLQFFGIIAAMIFLGPILMVFGKKGK